MKTKEELLKIYSCYLPYALSVSIMGEYIEVDETRLHNAEYDIYLTYEIFKIVS